ncbi:hypothetical protein V5799_032439 [Amblyomma americanum]|uniref:Uncharacterized protein n=1 Tax=Amblyomma americanum TaxID=6943 RepID=A0AAQ4DR59_AMBAM
MADIIVNDTVAKNMDISQEATDADARAADAGVAADAGGADAEAAVLPAAKEKDSGDAASDVPRDREPTPKPVKRSRSRRSDTPAPTGKGMESLPAKTDKPPVKQRITSYPPAKKNTGPCRQDADNVEPVFNVPYPIEAPKSMSSRFRRYLKMRDTDTFLTNEQYETIVVGIRPQVEKLYTEAKPHPLPEQFPSRDIPASWKIEKLKVEFNSTDFDTLIFVTFAFMLFHLRPSDFAKVERYFKPFVCTSLKKKYVFNHNVLCIQEHIRKSFSRNPHIFIPRDSDDEVVQPVLLAPLSPDNKYKLMLINGWTTPYFYPFVVDVENIGYKRLIDMIIATYVTTPSYTTDDIKCKIVKRLVYAGTVYKWHLQCMVKDIDGCIKFNDYRNREAWITDGVIDGVAVEIIMSSIRVMLTTMHVPFVGDLTNAVMHSLDNVARLPVAMIGPYYSIHAHICTSSLVKETVPGKYESTQSGPMYQLPPVPAFANHNYQCIRNMNVYLKTLEADPELQAYAQTIANGEVPPPPLPERIQPEPMLYDAANRPICVADPSTTQDDALMRDRIGRYIGINTAHARQAANMTFPINEPSSPPNDNFGIVETESTPMPYSIPTEPIYPYCIITEEAGTVNIDGPVHKKSKLSNSDVVVVSPLSTNSEFDSTTESVVDTPMCYLSPSSVVSPATNQDSSELFIDHDNVNIAVHDIELPPLEYTTSQDDSLLGEKKKKRKYTKRSK